MLRTTRKETDSGETTSRDRALQEILLYFGVGGAGGWRQVGSRAPVTSLEKAQICLAHYVDHCYFLFLTASENVILIY